MLTITQKLYTLKFPYHFLTYALTFFCYGSMISAIGPLVPYLTHLTGIPQTEYSFLFFSRSLGFVVGAVILKLIQSRYKFHTVMSVSNILMLGGTFMFSTILNPISQAFWFFFISCICCFYQVIINISILQTQRTGDVEFWITITHVIFGLGGLMGPLLVYYFEQYSYTVMGLLIVGTAIGYIKLQSSQGINQRNHTLQTIQKTSLLKQLQIVTHQDNFQAIEVSLQKNNQIISKPIQYLLSCMFFIYIGLQTIFASWISSFAVLSNVATKQQATNFSSIFWLTITISRLIISFFTISSTKKLFIHIQALCMFCFIAILLIRMDLSEIACYFSSISFGIAFSSLFPILFSISAEYNMMMTAAQTSSFMIYASLGEGILSTLTGYLMNWIVIEMLFYSILILTFIFGILAWILKGLFQEVFTKENMIVQQMQQRNNKTS